MRFVHFIPNIENSAVYAKNHPCRCPTCHQRHATQIGLSRSGHFRGGHIGWSQSSAVGFNSLTTVKQAGPCIHTSWHNKGTFTLCPSPCPSPCPYQSPCPNNSHFLMKLEAVFRLHQFPYQSPIQCHQISVRSVSIGPPTVKNWYGRPFPSESCKSLYKITLWRLARQLWTWN